ncbi:hypothetical protein B6U67_00715 [Methanosarcinales archaeon ex4484_138]|nr:MAG: hypothetical protein B6U67_00715 [Methanosarcinales archaeon ex4484_138]
MMLSKLICTARKIEPEMGDTAGNCIFCGEYSENGYIPGLKTNFTAYEWLQDGEIVCPYCNHMYNEQEYRKSMWVVSDKEYKKIKREEVKDLLLNPPEPPFAIYLTRTYKKQGWIRMMNKINYDQSEFFVGMDYDLIFVKSIQLNVYIPLVELLIERKIPKKEVQSGRLSPKSIEKIEMNIDVMKKVEKYANDPLWEVCVWMM